MNRYSPFLRAVDPSRAAVPVLLTPQSSAVAQLLATEPGAKLVQQSVQRRAQAGHAPAPWHDKLLQGQALLDQTESWLSGAGQGTPRPQQIAQRHEILRLYAARVLYATALKLHLTGVQIRKPLNPFSVWYLFCAGGDVQDEGEFRTGEYFSWRGKVMLEALITSSDDPGGRANELAEDTVEAMLDLEGSGFGEVEQQLP